MCKQYSETRLFFYVPLRYDGKQNKQITLQKLRALSRKLAQSFPFCSRVQKLLSKCCFTSELVSTRSQGNSSNNDLPPELCTCIQ